MSKITNDGLTRSDAQA